MDGTRTHGFTLLEILIAMGLFAIAVTGLIALFPAVQRVSLQGEEEARATLIAENILETLAIPSSRSFQVATGTKEGKLVFEALDPFTGRERSVVYGASCEPLFPVDGENAVRPATNPESLDLATVRLESKPSLPGLVLAEIEVSSPAAAPASSRSSHRFVRLFPMPPVHE
jgi:prepilin-type N-terminal cleavage/methylation domain-containing protein